MSSGALENVEPCEGVRKGGGAAPDTQGEVPVRSAGIDRAVASEGASAKKSGSVLLIDRIVDWYQRAISAAASDGGSMFAPGRRAFAAGSALDSVQFAALARLVGASGMKRLHDMLIKMAGHHAAKVRALWWWWWSSSSRWHRCGVA